MIALAPKFPPVISAYMQSDARTRHITGPFRSGKSSASAVEAVRRSAMQKRGPDGYRRSKWMVVRNTMPELRDTTIPTFLNWFPSGSIGFWKETGKTYYIQVDDIRAEVMFRALDSADDVKNLLSLEVTGAYFNEVREIAREIIEGVDGRIGQFPAMKDGGPSWYGVWADTNPPEELSYLHSMYEKRDPDDPKKAKNNEWQVFRQPPAVIKLVDGSYVTNPVAENLANLIPGYYEKQVDGKTLEYIRVNLMAEYGRSKGGMPVHPEFDRHIHVAKGPLIPNRDLVLLLCADFGLTPAMALKQQDAFGRVLTLDDIACFDMGLERAIETKLLPLLKTKYKGGAKNGEYEIIVTGDPSGNTGSQGNEISCVDIFRDYKKYLGKVKMASTNAPVARRAGTDHFLTRKEPPTYLVDPNCDATIAALSGGFMYKKFKDGRHSEEVDKNDHSHIGEANEYGDMYFAEGRRRKAEQRPDQMNWAETYQAQVQAGSAYNTPR